MWPYDLAFHILGSSQRFRERALTSMAEEVVVGQIDLPLLELSGKILGSLPVPLNLPVFCRMAVRCATRAEKNGSRGSLVSQLRPLAQSPENSPQSNSPIKAVVTVDSKEVFGRRIVVHTDSL